MFARAIAEFEFTLTFANAPIDRFARGETDVMTVNEKQGALLFFGAAQCSVCHSVAGQSNEMFSDFQEHVIGVPQIVPSLTNATFDGPGLNEDFGLEQVTERIVGACRSRMVRGRAAPPVLPCAQLPPSSGQPQMAQA